MIFPDSIPEIRRRAKALAGKDVRATVLDIATGSRQSIEGHLLNASKGTLWLRTAGIPADTFIPYSLLVDIEESSDA